MPKHWSRILHCNVTAHPTAAWTLQQFREAVASDYTYRFLIHDRDSIFSAQVDNELEAFGLKVLRTPVQAPRANAYCERLVGTMRRGCLDFMLGGAPRGVKSYRKCLVLRPRFTEDFLPKTFPIKASDDSPGMAAPAQH